MSSQQHDDLRERVVRLEVIAESMDASLKALTKVIEHQDYRLGRIEVTVAKGLGAIAVTILLANLAFPLMLRLI